jgi:hypothetical protein
VSLFIHGLLVGFALCFFAFGVLGALLLAFRTPSPVLRRRVNRDRLPEVGDVPPQPGAEVGGIEYRFMGATGLEE